MRPARPRLRGLDDSTALTPEVRESLAIQIGGLALGIGLGVVPAEEIDEVNIYQASLRAMMQAVEACQPGRPTYLLLDAVRLKDHPLPQQALIGGDGRCACIAAASVIAKVARDRMMVELDSRFPGYDFAVHKGYGTAHHLERLRALGPSPVHRRSFAPVRDLEAAIDLERAGASNGERGARAGGQDESQARRQAGSPDDAAR
jgi:ribonuclease HII